MNSQELETARRMKLNLVVLIIEDHAYGMIRWKQAVDGFRGLGPDLRQSRLRRLRRRLWRARPAGHDGVGVGPALEEAFSAGGLHLITVPIDYSENIRVLVDELRHMQD